jgi:putative ABC transport system ATP-binding protein
MSAASDLIALEAVSRVFDGGAVVALRDIELCVPHGDCVAIVGPSGSGKSSLINMMSGIDAPSAGAVRWNGDEVRSRKEWTELRRRHIGIVFQEFNLMPTLTATENVELALFGRGLMTTERRSRAAAALEQVGLGARLGHLPQAMSGGERQRVAIARSIVNQPKLLLADEPTGNLDSENAAMIADILIGLHETGETTLVLVTHDDALAGRCARQIRIRDGSIVEDRTRLRAAPRLPKEAAE